MHAGKAAIGGVSVDVKASRRLPPPRTLSSFAEVGTSVGATGGLDDDSFGPRGESFRTGGVFSRFLLRGVPGPAFLGAEFLGGMCQI